MEHYAEIEKFDEVMCDCGRSSVESDRRICELVSGRLWAMGMSPGPDRLSIHDSREDILMSPVMFGRSSNGLKRSAQQWS